MAPVFTVAAIAFSERPVVFRAPFRFGAVTVNGAVQLFVHVELDIGGKRVTGASAELMVPKWFNKDPSLSAEDTARQLRRAADIARGIYLERRSADTAFGLSATCYPAQIAACGQENIPPLAAAFGAAEIDKAILDAVLRASNTNFFVGMNDNVAGLDARLTPDINEAAIEAFLRSRAPRAEIAIRYTIGMLDTFDDIRGAAAQYRYFKLKLCGDPAKDRARLVEISQALGDCDYRATADANEQYKSLADLTTLVNMLGSDGALKNLASRLLYIEQPFARENTWNVPLGDLANRAAFIIDEADDSYDAFPRAKALGYRGCSSKSCKGLYKSILNGVRAKTWGNDYFISAEDLTCQAGLALQQDTALVALHGLTHAERNGHHYVDGFADTPAAEVQAFLNAHPDLYEQNGNTVRLAVRDGTISTFSLAVPGFACGAKREAIGPRTQHTVKEFAS